MDRNDCVAYIDAICNFKQVRLKHLESMVQGEGGYKLVMERIKHAEEAFHDHVDALENSLDECIEEIMKSNIRQLTKMEEMQATVLNANFETLNKYFIHVEKKLRKTNSSRHPDEDYE